MTLELHGSQHGEARARILAWLANHKPADAKEARDIKRIASLVKRHPDIFSPACQVGHITASAIIVDLGSRRTLLHYHKRLARWLQVGGHADDETELAQVALREAREETGLPDLAHHPAGSMPAPIDCDQHRIPQRGAMPAHLHFDFRFVLTTRQPQALAPEPGESRRFQWLGFEEALAMDSLDASLRRLLRKADALFVAPDARGES